MTLSRIVFLAFFLMSFYCSLLRSQTVYIAETGKKYHSKKCAYVQKNSREMELKKAIKEGYKPCPACGADKIKPKEENTESQKKEVKGKPITDSL